MKKLFNLKDEVWFDETKIEGVIKEEAGYRLVMPNGMALPVYLTKKEVETVLKAAKIEGFK